MAEVRPLLPALATAMARGLSARSAIPSGAFPVDRRGSWWGLIREGDTGDWQKHVEVRLDTVLTSSWVFRCIAMISADIGKLCLNLVEEGENEIWSPSDSASFSPVLRKPNLFQNRIQFVENWVVSKLTHGNTYVLKERDNRGVVVRLHILDGSPGRVMPLVAQDGSVFYQLARDLLAGIPEGVIGVPASEIIHDRFNCLFHPLVGLSPIYACGLTAIGAHRIQSNSAHFFGNGARPGGVLTAPGAITDETAARLKTAWDTGFTGANAGKVAVLGDNLTFQPMIMNATDAQLIEQLKWSAETICGVFGIPAYKMNVGPIPLNNNVEALEQQYYSQCLQTLIESIELCLDEGLGLPPKYGVEFDLQGLLRMDTASQIEALSNGVKGGLLKPDEGRKRLNLPPVAGGDAVYLQQQNWSLEALSNREASGATPTDAPAPPAPPPPPPKGLPANDDAQLAIALHEIRKGLA